MARTHIHKYQTRYHAQTTYSRVIRARRRIKLAATSIVGWKRRVAALRMSAS